MEMKQDNYIGVVIKNGSIGLNHNLTKWQKIFKFFDFLKFKTKHIVNNIDTSNFKVDDKLYVGENGSLYSQ